MDSWQSARRRQPVGGGNALYKPGKQVRCTVGAVTQLWNSIVVLSTEFYNELVAHAVPIDLRALRALKGSPLALD